MTDLNTAAQARAQERLRDEQIIWIATVHADGQPQVSPVWFLWEDGAFLVFSEPGSQKVRNLQSDPQVGLHLDSDGRGGDIVSIEGTAELGAAAAPQAYLAKYEQGIAALGLTPETMAERYSTAIRITPTRIRAW